MSPFARKKYRDRAASRNVPLRNHVERSAPAFHKAAPGLEIAFTGSKSYVFIELGPKWFGNVAARTLSASANEFFFSRSARLVTP